MPKNSESLNRSLFDLLHTRGYDPTMLDTSGKEIPTPEEAEVFQFDFIKDGENYGKVTISIDGAHKLIIYFNDKVADSEKEDSDNGDISWYKLLNQLKRFAQSYQLSFELRNVNNLKHDMAKRDYMKKKESIAEGYYPMGKKASYSDAVPNVKIVLQHTRQIEEGEQRYRNVAKIFLENEAGERFLAPTTKPGIARVYARHIAEGGQPHDERWNHIGSLCEEYQKMAGFVRATRNGQFNESVQRLVTEGVNHYQKLRESLTKLASHRGYNAYFESYTPALMEDEASVDLSEMFMSSSLDPRIESAMPILSKLSKNLSEMSEVGALAEWADSLLEAPGAETLKHNQSTEKQNLKAFGLAEDEAEQEPAIDELDEDESLTSNNPQGIPEGRLDGEADIDSPVADAITRRILMRHTDLLAKYGPEKVADAIANIADDLSDWIGPDDEIGSSDVSGWVKRVEQELGGLEESIADDYEYMSDRELIRHAGMLGLEKNCVPDDEGGLANRREIIYLLQKEAEGDLDEGILDTVKKVGGKVLDKLGHGSDEDLLKDLKKKAGVRNPETGKPSMAHSDVEKVDEDGQFAGDYKTGPEGQWRNKGPKANKPAKVGDLVGASESIQNTLNALTEMDKSEDSKGPEGKAKPIKAKDFAKDAEKKLEKHMDKAHKKDVKEGQEDLNAIMRLLGK